MKFKLIHIDFLLINPIKPLPLNLDGYEHYIVTFWGGFVFNTKTGNKMNCWRNESGYRRVRLSSKGKAISPYVHRLVGLTYIPNFNNKQDEINHIDTIRHNCDRYNLEWMTRQENMSYQYNRFTKKFYEKELYPIDSYKPTETPNVGEDVDLPF